MIEQVVAQWEQVVSGERADLESLLAQDVVFYSPIVYSPQLGKDITALYLRAAAQTIGGPDFTYTKQVLAGDTAVLEFETTMDGTYVNGVDIIRCSPDGLIVEFRVMIRPLQAITAVHAAMGAMLDALKP